MPKSIPRQGLPPLLEHLAHEAEGDAASISTSQ